MQFYFRHSRRRCQEQFRRASCRGSVWKLFGAGRKSNYRRHPNGDFVDAAAAAMRDAMRHTVRRCSLWYLVQGILMVVTGVLALIYPWIASVAMVRLLGWFLISSGVLQAIGLVGAREVPYFWLELISAVLANHPRAVAAAPYRCRAALLQRSLDRLSLDDRGHRAR